MEYHIEKLASPNAVVGEGPVWSSEEKKKYIGQIYMEENYSDLIH